MNNTCSNLDIINSICKKINQIEYNTNNLISSIGSTGSIGPIGPSGLNSSSFLNNDGYCPVNNWISITDENSSVPLQQQIGYNIIGNLQLFQQLTSSVQNFKITSIPVLFGTWLINLWIAFNNNNLQQ